MPKGKDQGKTTAEITHITGNANEKGGNVNIGGQVSKDIGNNTTLIGTGNVGRSQSFQGGGGQTSWGIGIGISKKW